MFYGVLYYLSLILVPFIFYSIIFKRNNNYYIWNRDWFYLIKFYAAKKEIKSYQLRHKKEAENIGNDFETEIYIPTVKHSNSQNFYGVDQNGNSITLSLNLGVDKLIEVRLLLRLANGEIYTLPGENALIQTNISKDSWNVKGLSIVVLEPFVRSRILFNGLLLNVNKGIVEHIQLNLIFSAASSPTFSPQDMDVNILADALAKDIWRDGTWKEHLVDQSDFQQFGVLKGFIKGDSYPEDYILHLQSCRTKTRGVDDRIILTKALKLFFADEYGNVIIVVIKSFKNGCSQMNYGCVLKSDNIQVPLLGIDISLQDIGTYEIIPEVITIHITIPGNVFKCVVHLNMSKCIKSSNNYEYIGYDCYNIPAECDINMNQGRAIVELWYKKRGHGVYIPKHLLCDKISEYSLNNLVSDIKNEESRILEVTGGKGTSLALLTSLNSNDFIVPEGCVVTTNAYKLQINSSAVLQDAIKCINDICCGVIEGNLEDACKRVTDAFNNEEILPVITKSIIKYIGTDIGDSSKSWAVRSSAVGEDSEDLSAAGQNETYLGCFTIEYILQSVSSCWASLYSSQSVKYRWQHGLPVATDMAVVIQKMVPADCAGVLFTRHPSTSNPSQMVITSNFGLGETVVSGESDPDTFVLNRTWDNKISILSKNLGIKNRILKIGDDGLQETTESSEKWSLSEEKILFLGKIGVALEEAFGNSRDIEWAYSKDRLYLLQSRPITTLNTWTDFELTHEMDYPLLSKHLVFTVANIKEVIPNGTTVLAQTSSIKSLDRALQIFALENCVDYVNKGCPTFEHNMFIDVINSIHKNVTNNVQISSLILDLAIFGHPILDEKILDKSVNIRGLSPRLEVLRQTLRIFACARQNKKTCELAKKLTDDLNLTFKKEESLWKILNKIDKAITDIIDIGICHAKTSAVCVFYQIFAMNLLLENGKELLPEHYSDFATILSSCEDVVSAEVPLYIEQMAEIIRKNGFTKEFCEIVPEQGVEWLKQNCVAAYKQLELFLSKHGHRSLGEFEVIEKCWADDSSTIISMIQINVKHGKVSDKKKMSVDEILQKLVSPKSSITRFIIKFIMRKMRVAVGNREQTKSEFVRAINKLRRAYRYLGQEMASQGIIPSKDLIFHLTHHELWELSMKRQPSLITKAMRRQKLYSKWRLLRFPEISFGVPVSVDESTKETIATVDVIKGTSASSGVAKARVCVLNNIDEINQLQKGDILITYSTDIAWSPYFPMLSGIVTELGGLVSHGAVVAREYGLPCIVGVTNARKYFKTGEMVLIDGNKGQIGRITDI